MTPRMFSSTRKCWPSAFFGVTLHGSRKAAVAFACVSGGEPRLLLVADAGERSDRVDEVRGLVLPTAHRLRREVWAVRLHEDPILGDGVRPPVEAHPPSDRSRFPRRRRSTRARVQPAADRQTRSSGGSRGPRSLRARRRCPRPPPGCGRRPEARARPPGPAAHRTAGVAQSEWHSASRCRGRSRPPRPLSDGRAARAARRGGPLRGSPPDAGRFRAPHRRLHAPRRARARRDTSRSRCRS